MIFANKSMKNIGRCLDAKNYGRAGGRRNIQRKRLLSYVESMTEEKIPKAMHGVNRIHISGRPSEKWMEIEDNLRERNNWEKVSLKT